MGSLQTLSTKLKVVNFWAGPGAGKSTTSAALFARLKGLGLKVELVTEICKDAVYEGDHRTLSDAVWVLAHQSRKLARLVGHVDVVVSDCPLPLCMAYSDATPWLAPAYHHLWDQYDNVNVWVNRVKPYQPYGRTENEAKARAKDHTIFEIMKTFGGLDMSVNGDEHAVDVIVKEIGTRLGIPERPIPMFFPPPSWDAGEGNTSDIYAEELYRHPPMRRLRDPATVADLED